MSEWSVWKASVIGLKRDPNMRMVMNEEALDALFRMLEASGLRMTGPIPMWSLGSTKQAPRHCCRSVQQSAVGTKDPAKQS